MSRWIKAGLLFIIVAAILAAGFLLPSIIVKVQDLRTFGDTKTIKARPIMFEDAELDLIGKLELSLALSNGECKRIEQDSGKYMNQQTAYDTAVCEINKLCDIGIIKFNTMGPTLDTQTANLVVSYSEERFAQSMLVWEFKMVDEAKNTILFYLDDKTGKIVYADYNRFVSYEEISDPRNQERLLEYYYSPDEVLKAFCEYWEEIEFDYIDESMREKVYIEYNEVGQRKEAIAIVRDISDDTSSANVLIATSGSWFKIT